MVILAVNYQVDRLWPTADWELEKVMIQWIIDVEGRAIGFIGQYGRVRFLTRPWAI